MRSLIAWLSDRHARLSSQASPSRYPDKTGWPGRPTPHHQPLLPVAFYPSQAPSPRPGLPPAPFRAMFPVTLARSAARMDPEPGGRRRNGFWPLFLPPQKAPCPPPSPPPRIPPSPLKPPTGSRSSARLRTWEPAVWGRRWGRMRCG